jgi:hypothetical protein
MKSARDRWFAMLAAERDRRAYAELLVDGRDPLEAFDAQLREIAERLAGTGGPLPREQASIAERLAVLIYIPQYLTATEIEEETAVLDAWFKDYKERRRSQ